MSPPVGNKSISSKWKDSPKMFDNDYLDYWSRVYPITVISIFLPTIIYLYYYGSASFDRETSLKWFFGGLLMWTFSEYWLHRLVFHFDIPGNKIVNTIHFYLHGVHHDHPQDPLRLMLPPGLSIPMASVFVYAYKICLPNTWMLFTSGFFAGYLTYDCLHYHFHHHKPLTRYGEMLRTNHMRHHFQDGNHGYGVSSPLWDYVFFTNPNPNGKINAHEE